MIDEAEVRRCVMCYAADIAPAVYNETEAFLFDASGEVELAEEQRYKVRKDFNRFIASFNDIAQRAEDLLDQAKADGLVFQPQTIAALLCVKEIAQQFSRDPKEYIVSKAAAERERGRKAKAYRCEAISVETRLKGMPQPSKPPFTGPYFDQAQPPPTNYIRLSPEQFCKALGKDSDDD